MSMSKFKGPEDIYKLLVDDSDENWLYGLVAFAVIEEQKIDWIRHRENHGDATPTAEEIKSWYQQQPMSVIGKAKGTAENALRIYSDEVVELVLEQHGREVEEGILINEIRELKPSWPLFGFNLLSGFLSAILFALFLGLVAFLLFNGSSPIDIGSSVGEQIEDSDNG